MSGAPKQPTLYRLAADGASLALQFAECRRCAALSFPANVYGCSACGSEDLSVVERPGEGVLKAVATLHAAILPGLTTPQVVGDIEIASGIVEEVLIDGDEAGLAPGATMIAVPHPVEDGLFECRFRAVIP